MQSRADHDPVWSLPFVPSAPLVGGEPGFEAFDEATCLRLLEVGGVGRVGLSVGSLPVIYPVTFVLADRTIVFPSEPGDKTKAAAKGSVACLQVDQFDPSGRAGWSILATGRLSLAEPDRAADYERLPTRAWSLAGPAHWIEMPIELLSGCSVPHAW
ncbi:MAG: pyridoxamine 5'-phosphate oxidase family protein [Acidimicrobiales bacterium]